MWPTVHYSDRNRGDEIVIFPSKYLYTTKKEYNKKTEQNIRSPMEDMNIKMSRSTELPDR